MTYFKLDLIKEFQSITGKSFEDSFSILNNSNAFSSSSMNVNVKEYHRLASNHDASSESIINSLSKATGRSYENIMSEINMIPVTPLKK